MKTKTPLNRTAALFAFALLATFGATHKAKAQFNLTGSNYTQDFNTLPTVTTNGVPSRDLENINVALDGWYFFNSGSVTNANLIASTGSTTTGGNQNLGLSGNTDRSLGGLAINNTVPSWGFWFSNSVGATITNLQIVYKGETWRVSVINRSDSYSFSYSGTNTSLAASTWTNDAFLGYTNVATNATGSGSLLQSATISNNLAVNITNGGTFFLRWLDVNISGNDDAMSMDDFSLTAFYSAIIAGTYWAPSAGGGGNGTWGSGSDVWATSAGTQGTGPQDATGTLIFGNAAGTVAVSGTVSAVAGMQFSTDDYLVYGGTSISLTGANAAANTITTDASVGATINSVLAGSAGMTKAGTGTLTLSGANTYAGGTTISAGRLIGDTTSLRGNITNNAALTFNQSTNGTYGGVISGSGGTVTKSGTGTVTFTQNNSYTGATTVGAGRLVVNGSQGSSAVTVNSGASLAGSGTVGGLTVSGLLAPGTSIGTLSAGSTTFNGGGSLELEIFDWVNLAGTGWDLFAITGDLTLNNTSGSPFTIDLVSLANSTTPGLSIDWDQNVSFTNTFVTVSGSLLGTPFASNLFTFNTNGFQNMVNGTFSITNVGNNLALLYTTSFVPATEYIWNTGAGAWGTGGSWSGGVAPSNNSAIIFSGAGGASTNNLVNNVQSLLFSNSAGSYTVSGDALTVGALGIDNESTAAQTINNNLTLGAAQSFLAANGDLTFGGTIDNSGNLLTIAGNSNTAINGAVSGNGGLTKSGTGSLTLGGNNSYTGALSANGGTTLVNGTQAATTINVGGGTLLLGNNDRLANGATVALTTGTVNFGGFSDTIATFNQSGGAFTNGTLTATTYGLSGGTVGGTLGAGTANVTGGVTLSGVIDSTLNINTGGTLTLAAADRIGNSSAVTVDAGTLATVTFSDTVGSLLLTNSGSLTGTGTITAGTYTLNGGTVGANLGTGTATSSAGTTTLNGTLAGDLTVSGGTLTLGGADRLANSSAVTVSAGTLNFGGFADTVGSFSLSGGVFTNGTVTTTTYALSGGTMGGTLGAGAANVTGGVTLSGVIDSTLNINTGGTLTLAAADRIGNSSAVTVDAGTLATATFNDTVSSLLLTNNGSITGTGTITASTYTLNGGTVSANLGAGTANVSAGTTTLNGAFAVTTLNIDGGTLALGGNGRIENAAVVNLSSGVLDMVTFADGVGTFNMTGGTVNGSGANLLSAVNGLNLQAGTINANIGNSAVGISNGTTTINGTVGGAVTVSSGTADLNGALASSLTASGGTVNLSNTVAGNVTVSGGTVNLGSADRIGASSAVNVSSGDLILNGNDSVGAVAVTGGTIGGSGVLTGTSYAVQDGTISAGIGGSGAMTKTGAGTTTLSANNSGFSGAVAVNQGAILASTSGALGSGTVTVTNGSTLAASGVTLANDFTIGSAAGMSAGTNVFIAGWDFQTTANGGTAIAAAPSTPTSILANFGNQAGAATILLNGSNGSSTWITATSGNQLTAFGGTAINATNTFVSPSVTMSTTTSGAAALAVQGSSANGQSMVFSLNMSNIASLSLSYASQRTATGFNSHVWEYSSDASSWTAFWTNSAIASSFELESAPSALTALSNSATAYLRLTVSGGTGGNNRLDNVLLNGVSVGSIVGASGSGTLGIEEAGTATFSGNVVNNNAATFTAASGGTAIFSGAISGEGTLSKTGIGTVTLSGASANTFTGTTTVSAGTLQLNKTTDTAAIAGDIEVNDGAFLLLSSSGNVSDTAEITLSGGTITRGAGASEVFGALTLGLTGGTLDFGTGATGTLGFGEYAPSALLTINNFFQGNTLTFGSNLTDDINNTALFSFDNGFNSSWNSGTSTFTITAIPEPSTYLAAAGLLSLMLWPSRKRLLKDAKKILGLRAPMRDRLAAQRQKA